jgi:signal peptidase II
MMLMGVSMMVLAMDQFTKLLIIKTMELHESVAIFPDLLYLTYTQNSGTAFGFMSNMGTLVRIPFFIMATAAATFIVYMYQRMVPHEKVLTRVALGLVWGGALGNLVDRLLYGNVIDFIEVRYHEIQWFPYIFNMADSCITTGLLFLLFEFLTSNRRKSKA